MGFNVEEIRGDKAKLLVPTVQSIMDQFGAVGIRRLTLRQIYYQLVANKIVVNKRSEYQYLSRVLVRARERGWINPNRIVDRVRWIEGGDGDFKTPIGYYDNHVGGFLDSGEEYVRNRIWWENQDAYVLFAVEKDALAEVVEERTSDFNVGVAVNRGYSSFTFARHIAKTFRRHAGKERLVLKYLGDMDPSGKDMVRDIDRRIADYSKMTNIEVEPVALTLAQVQELKLPPDPVKNEDPRTPAYVEEYGDIAVELDAVPPDVLLQWVEDAIRAEIDEEAWEETQERLRREEYKLKGLLGVVRLIVEEIDSQEIMRELGDEYDSREEEAEGEED